MTTPTRMKGDQTGARILNLTLEIIYLLTGEDYTVVRKTSHEYETFHRHHCMSEGQRETQITIIPPLSLAINNNKILELTQKITELLTGKVPIRCQDVSVYFSMEEWEYLEGHKDLYKDMMEDQPPLTSLDGSSNRNPPERCPRPLDSQDSIQKGHTTPRHDQVEEQKDIKIEIKEEEEPRIGDQQSMEEGEMITESKPEEFSLHENANGYFGPSTSDGHLNVAPGYNAQNNDFTQNEKLVIQQKTHTSESPFSCSECGKCFSRKEKLVTHQRNHTGERPFSCTECGKCFARKEKLLIHKRNHTGERPFSCTDCGKSFVCKEKVVIHQRTHVECPFSCTECGKSFVCKEKLVIHQRSHVERPFSCSDCGKCFSEKRTLVVHQRTHTGERPYSCAECGKCFADKSVLHRHQRIHTGERPYTCSVCEKSFSLKVSLLRHQRTHTGERPFSCSDCGKYFNDRGNLFQHQKIHTGERPFSCSECGKCFIDRKKLIRHQKVHKS